MDKPDRSRPLLQVLNGQRLDPPPIWLMRQAGRYLPEYRATRATAGSFLDLCYTPKLAAEVTLQPIRRFAFDAAILFSDILVVPHALGQRVRFVEGEGPRLDPITDAAGLAKLTPGGLIGHLAPVYETVSRVRSDLPPETALIGFCGAPWTVATYMVAGRGTLDQAPARLLAYREPTLFGQLIDMLVEASIEHLSAQVAAGADAVQIFDSWAGVLPETEWRRWCLEPVRRIVGSLKQRHPGVPVIGFPRGSGVLYGAYGETGVNAIGCDTMLPLNFMRNGLAGRPVQGNLDPLLLVSGGRAMEERVRETLEQLAPVPHIFNLGHGIVPETPPENVARLVELVRSAGHE